MNKLYEFHYTRPLPARPDRYYRTFQSVIAPNLAHAMAALPRDASHLQMKRVTAQ